MSTTPRSRTWTLLIVSLGLFMVVLDNLVINVALPSIHRQLGASIQALEWTVNAYVLSYAVLLLTGAAIGDRFGRKRMFIAGITLFTVSSAAAALAPSIGLLIAARAIQGQETAGAALRQRMLGDERRGQFVVEVAALHKQRMLSGTRRRGRRHQAPGSDLGGVRLHCVARLHVQGPASPLEMRTLRFL